MPAEKLLRNTHQRKVILEELKKLKTHPTADDLYEIVRRRIPRISLGTIYRNLELLAKNGIIQKLEHSGGKSRFDGNPENHYHVKCMRCGRVEDVDAEPIKAIERAGQTIRGYEIYGHHLEFFGICSKCRGKG
jgi:Fur family ferric uptake transcriptional regulator